MNSKTILQKRLLVFFFYVSSSISKNSMKTYSKFHGLNVSFEKFYRQYEKCHIWQDLRGISSIQPKRASREIGATKIISATLKIRFAPCVSSP